MREAGLGGGN
ncbi:hypothetical protein E2C01_098110 [Portunus trituberculatus]|uniref:Uncharacterized protein n=1 Tax=Portunus trituberculatus TaxID=210409 RepID=A0A5B7K0E1_PORTR|nr:hypothetical protein [Portunus trituberculatus]